MRFIVGDGFQGLQQACQEIYPRARFQRCWVHITRMIRLSIYSNNLIEGWNKHLKRRISHKEQFPSIESLDTFVCTFASEYNAKFFGKIHRGFGAAFSELQNMFGN